MSDAHDARVEELFAAALERPAAERPAFVADSTSDPQVRREVLELLAAHDSPGRFDSIGEWLRRADTKRAIQFTDLCRRLEKDLGKRYRIEREIARGGMAIVLQAEDLKHRRTVAMKVLRPSLARSLGPDRFLREISIAARLAHPHILALHDSGEADGLLYYVMPFVDGDTLRDRLRRDGRIPLDEALHIIDEVADALNHAHGQGVIHRDIKPENIMFQAGHALVGDFGIARAMSAAGGKTLSESGVLLGTPTYMSPEQARGEPHIDGRSDVYALACILFEMLAGRPPFAGDSAAATLKQHLEDRPPALRTFVSDVPRSIDAAIRCALSKDPTQRPQTVSAFVQDLRRFNRRAARWRLALALAGTAAIASGVAGAVLLVSRDAADEPVPSVMAVLPFRAAPEDTGLARLGRDLVVTVNANLDGVGEIRTIDALTVLARTADTPRLLAEEGATLARQLGASTVAMGTIVRAEPHVRIDLGLFSTDSLRLLARGSVTADPEDLTALTDSLTWMLLRAVWRTRAPPTPNVAAVTTHSVPALRAFLEGERESLDGRWSDAAESYGRAMQADPTFWLARWRFVFARWWYLEPPPDSILDPLFRNRFALPERDRLVLESWWSDTISVAVARGREAVEQYPDYWPGWMQYADWLFHVGSVLGYRRSETRAALENVVALNPLFIPAWEHLYWATITRDDERAGEALDALLRLGHGRSTLAEFGFDITRVYRLEIGYVLGSNVNDALADSIASDLVSSADRRDGGGATIPAIQAEISRRVLALEPRASLAAVHEQLLAEASAARGAWESAIPPAERHAVRLGGDPLHAYRYAVLGAWAGALSAGVAHGLREAAAQSVSRAGSGAAARAELSWLDGVLSFVESDPTRLAAARTDLRASGAAAADLLDQSLGALSNGLAGDTSGAAETLAVLNHGNADVLAPGYEDHPYFIAVCRLAAGRWFREAGRADDAVIPLMWFDAWWALDGYRPARRVLSGLASLELARAARLRGDVETTRLRYAEFLQRYDMPDPGLVPLIEEARRFVS